MKEWMWEALPVVGPIIGVILLMLVGDQAARWLNRKRKKKRTLWAVRPISVEIPTTREVERHSQDVEELAVNAEKIGPHVERDSGNVTDEEIDKWAHGN